MLLIIAALLFAAVPHFEDPFVVSGTIFIAVTLTGWWTKELALALSRNQGKIAGKVEKLQKQVAELQEELDGNS